MLIRLKRQFFIQMGEGLKLLEIRVAYANLKGIKAGDSVTFECGHDRLIVKIKEVRRYNTFATMLEKEDPNLIVPGQTKQQVLNTCRAIYPPEKEALGVLVFEVELKK